MRLLVAAAGVCLAVAAAARPAAACSKRHQPVFELFELARDVAVVKVVAVPSERAAGLVNLSVKQRLKGATRALVARETNTSCHVGFRRGRNALVFLGADRWPVGAYEGYIERPSAALLTTLAAWRDAATSRGALLERTCKGINYLAICEQHTRDASDDPAAISFLLQLRAVLAGELARFEVQYPCDSPHERRWFDGRVRTFDVDGVRRGLVAQVERLPRLRRRVDRVLHLGRHVGGEAFLEPEIVEPRHGHEVAKPLVGEFMRIEAAHVAEALAGILGIVMRILLHSRHDGWRRAPPPSARAASPTAACTRCWTATACCTIWSSSSRQPEPGRDGECRLSSAHADEFIARLVPRGFQSVAAGGL